MAKRILVVDDDENILNLERTILEQRGFEVTPAAGGMEALQVLSEKDFDLVGGTDFDAGIRVAPMQDGGFMVAGDSQSPVSGSRTSPGSGNDFWLVRLDAAGNRLYDVALDGGGNEVLRDFRRTADGGFLCAGESFPGAYFMNDYFVVKLSPEPISVWDSDDDGVPNDSDQCPNTEPRSVVDASGCSLLNFALPTVPGRTMASISMVYVPRWTDSCRRAA